MGTEPTTGAWERARAEFDCDCRETAVRFRTYANGQRVWVRQCLRCGDWSNPIKRDAVPLAAKLDPTPADEGLREQWNEARRTRGQELLAEEQEARRDARLDELAAYYQSPWWRMRRQARLEFDRCQCQARLPHCEGRASQAHHLSYEHLGCEPLFELASICSFCHARLHPHMGEGS